MYHVHTRSFVPPCAEWRSTDEVNLLVTLCICRSKDYLAQGHSHWNDLIHCNSVL